MLKYILDFSKKAGVKTMKFLTKISEMHFAINYKKEGVTQIFPVLLITNKNEKALLFGNGKYNFAIVFGRNELPLEDTVRKISERTKEFNFSKLTKAQKAEVVVVFCAIGLVGWLIYKHKYRK